MNFSVLWLFFTVPCIGLQCVIVVISGHTHLLFKKEISTDYDEMSDLSGSSLFLNTPF